MANWNQPEELRKKFRERAHTQREYVARLKEKPCMDCGKDFPWYIMEFDHRDGEIKKNSISKLIGRVGLETLLVEIAKCDLVCSNCHGIRTYLRMHRYRNQPANYTLTLLQ